MLSFDNAWYLTNWWLDSSDRYTKSNYGIRGMMKLLPCSRRGSQRSLHCAQKQMDWLDSVAGCWNTCYSQMCYNNWKAGWDTNCPFLKWAAMLRSISLLVLCCSDCFSAEMRGNIISFVWETQRGCTQFWTGLHPQTMTHFHCLSVWASLSTTEPGHTLTCGSEYHNKALVLIFTIL